MANYSYEKGRHGGTAGMIFPYFRSIDGLLPLDQDYRDFIPAGFLRCRGQILQADQFPALAEILGVGNSCIYKKQDTILQERNDSGTGGTFQLPDLGSKYITTSSNPGSYLNDTTVDTETNTTITRAGIATTISLTSDTYEFNYTGSFNAPAVTLSFSGFWRFVSPPTETESTSLSINNFTGHGHLGTFVIGSRVNTNGQGLKAGSLKWAGTVGFILCLKSGSVECSLGSINVGLKHRLMSFDEGGGDSEHTHQIPTPAVNAPSPTGSIPAATMSASSILTTVNVRRTQNVKMDNIAPKFILCEYLIKF